MKKIIILLVSCIIFSCGKRKSNPPKANTETFKPLSLSISKAHPQYWDINGKPQLLVGGGFKKTFRTPKVMNANLDSLKSLGCNLVSLSMDSHDFSSAFPFEKVENGFDVESWNETYWGWFESFLETCREKGLVVRLEIWPEQFIGKSVGNPFMANDQISEDNHSGEIGLDKKSQEKYLQKLLSISLKYDNILYSQSSATTNGLKQKTYWANFIHQRSEEYFQTVFIDGSEYSDISQTMNEKRGEAQYIEALGNAKATKPMAYSEISGGVLSDDDNGIEEGPERFWKSIFAGISTVRFEEEPKGAGLNDLARSHIKSLQSFIDSFPLYHSVPSNQLLTERSPNEAFCLASPEKYALYYPGCGQVILDMNGYEGEVVAKWLDLLENKWDKDFEMQTQNGKLELRSPCESKWLVVVAPKK